MVKQFERHRMQWFKRRTPQSFQDNKEVPKRGSAVAVEPHSATEPEQHPVTGVNCSNLALHTAES